MHCIALIFLMLIGLGSWVSFCPVISFEYIALLTITVIHYHFAVEYLTLLWNRLSKNKSPTIRNVFLSGH